MTDAAYSRITHEDGWISVAPLPSEEFLRNFYADLYYQAPPTASYQLVYDEVELQHRDLKCRALLHALGGHGLRAGDALLDVGAGEGFLMAAADRAGLAVTGADFSSYGVVNFNPHVADRLIVDDVFAALSALAEQGARFSACSALNVLEHVIDPARLCESLRRLLAPGGLVALTVPNDFSPLQQLLLETGKIDREFWFAPPQHLHYFNARSLPAFCSRAGFDVVDAFSDFPIDLFLLHPASNYVMHPESGPAAHRARMLHDLLIAERGLDSYLEVYRAMFRAGIGRDLTVILRATRETEGEV